MRTRNSSRRFSLSCVCPLVLGLLAVALLLGCAPQTPSETTEPDEATVQQLQELQAILTETGVAEEGAAEPETLAQESFVAIPPGAPLVFQPAPAQAGCPSTVHAAVRRSQGNNCVPGDPNQAVAEIGGYSLKCVANCNNAQRLQEANAAAEAECHAFCTQYGCGAQYSPRAQCASQSCTANSSSCPNPQCSTRDNCFLMQAGAAWNCECMPPAED